MFVMLQIAVLNRNEFLQWNPSFGETLDHVHFSCKKYVESNKIRYEYSLSNYIGP